jgi:hypothetical protein
MPVKPNIARGRDRFRPVMLKSETRRSVRGAQPSRRTVRGRISAIRS